MRSDFRRSKIMCLCLCLTCGLCFSSCGETGSGAAQKRHSSDSQSTTTVTASAPAENSPENVGTQADHLGIKDDIRALFGHERKSTTTTTTFTTTTTNAAEYEKELRSMYTLTMDDNYVVTRSGSIGDDLTWKITFNGQTVLERNAEDELTFKYDWYGSGNYTITLISFEGGEYRPVSNTIEYSVVPSDKRSSADEERILKLKKKLKSMCAISYSFDSAADDTVKIEKRIGLICDPDHDGYMEDVAFYAGKAYSGGNIQSVYCSDLDVPLPDSYDDSLTYYVWFDADTKQDYLCIVSVSGSDVTAEDACTGDILWSKSDKNGCTLFGKQVSAEELENVGFYQNALTFNADTAPDNDHVWVSRDHKPVLEGMYS